METSGFIRSVKLRWADVEDRTAYPFDIPAVRELDGLSLDPAVTILVGENGSGKSTILEAIAIAAGFNPEGGTKSFDFANRPSESVLHDYLTLVRNPRREKTGFFLRAESMFNVATWAEDSGLGAYGWENLHTRSHGEAFLYVVSERFGANGLYLLDEPESALSPQRQLALLGHMHRLVERGSQFIVSTHSPLLLAHPGARLYGLSEEGIRETTLEETEHYTVTRSFLNDPERMVRRILDDDA